MVVSTGNVYVSAQNFWVNRGTQVPDPSLRSLEKTIRISEESKTTLTQNLPQINFPTTSRSKRLSYILRIFLFTHNTLSRHRCDNEKLLTWTSLILINKTQVSSEKSFFFSFIIIYVKSWWWAKRSRE